MKPIKRLLAAVAACACLSSPALAVPLISLVPSIDKVHPPENFQIDVVISGLEPPGQLLGAFDFTLRYNPAVVRLLPPLSRFGTSLGEIGNPLQTVSGAHPDTPPGVLRLFEVSLLEASIDDCVFCSGPFLADLQDDSFTLASLGFQAIRTPPAGFTNFILPAGPFTYTDVNGVAVTLDQPQVLGDAAGNPITGFRVQNTTVRVPEPAGALLAGTALLALLGTRRRRPMAGG